MNYKFLKLCDLKFFFITCLHFKISYQKIIHIDKCSGQEFTRMDQFE